MQNIVFLPASDPRDGTYGHIPDHIPGFDDVRITQVEFPSLVWYNARVQAEAVSLIRSLELDSLVLIGFSKSGLGAWNIARAVPELAAATVIYDAPMVRLELPPWGTGPFYENDAAWQQDLPIRSVTDFQKAMSDEHRLVLISGPGFADEMRSMSEELERHNLAHTFIDRSATTHHWNSGWIEAGLDALLR